MLLPVSAPSPPGSLLSLTLLFLLLFLLLLHNPTFSSHVHRMTIVFFNLVSPSLLLLPPGPAPTAGYLFPPNPQHPSRGAGMELGQLGLGQRWALGHSRPHSVPTAAAPATTAWGGPALVLPPWLHSSDRAPEPGQERLRRHSLATGTKRVYGWVCKGRRREKSSKTRCD